MAHSLLVALCAITLLLLAAVRRGRRLFDGRFRNPQFHFHATVLLAALAGLVVCDGLSIALAEHRDVAYGNARLVCQIAGDGLRAALTQLVVVFGRTGLIREALNLD